MRHFWFDRIVEMESGVRARGIKGVALSEDFFDHHFPGNPIYPGIYVLEGLAQVAGHLLYRTTEGQRIALLASVDRARFTSFARPGDALSLEVTIEGREAEAARVMGSASVGDRAVAAARMSFRLLEPGRLIAEPYLSLWRQSYDVWRGDYLDPDG